MDEEGATWVILISRVVFLEILSMGPTRKEEDEAMRHCGDLHTPMAVSHLKI